MNPFRIICHHYGCRLSINCGFGAYLPTALRNQFVFGLKSERIQSCLLEISDLTLDKASKVAKSMELSAKDAAQLHRPSAAASVNHVQHKVGTGNGGGNNLQNNSNAQQSKTTTAPASSTGGKGTRCYRCGSTKHLANKCST